MRNKEELFMVIILATLPIICSVFWSFGMKDRINRLVMEQNKRPQIIKASFWK